MDANQDLICPITLEAFQVPVRAKDGYVYERSAITRWIKQNGTSPLTRQILRVEDLSSQIEIRNLADQHHQLKKFSIRKHIRQATVHPLESYELNPSIDSSHRKSTWILILILFICIGSILGLTILLILTAHKSDVQMKCDVYRTGSSVTIFIRLVNISEFDYTYYSFSYQSQASNEKLVFTFHHQSSHWCLDDITMRDSNSQIDLISNGNFENNFLEPFYTCAHSNQTYQLDSYSYSGMYAFCSQRSYRRQYLIQNLKSTEGHWYNLSFWLTNHGESLNKFQVSIIS